MSSFQFRCSIQKSFLSPCPLSPVSLLWKIIRLDFTEIKQKKLFLGKYAYKQERTRKI